MMRRFQCWGIFLAVGWVLAGAPEPMFLSAQTLPILLDTLEVQVGSRANPRLPVLTRSIQILSQTEILDLPVRTLPELLSWAVGVDVQTRSPAQSDLSIRGAGFEQVVVLVNGVRMSDPQTGHFDLDLAVPLDQVERVEILRGTASALYGSDAVGGVVNVVTKDAGTGWSGRAEGGSWGSARVSGDGGFRWTRTGTIRAGGELSRSDGHRAGTDFETLLLGATAQRPAGAGRMTAQAGFARRDFGARDFYAPYPSFEKTRTYTSAVGWASQEENDLAVDVGASFRRHEDEFTLIRSDPSVYQNRHTSSQMGGNALIRTSPWDGFDLVFGGEGYLDMLRSNALGDREETRAAVFGEMVFGGSGTEVVSLGARRDWHEGFGSFLSPSFSASFRLNPSVRIRGALGRSFRAPSWTDRYYRDPANIGQPDLDPERTWSAEMGLDLVRREGLRGAFTLFGRRAKDLIDWARPVDAGADTPWETRNVDEADFVGMEVEVELLGPWSLRWTGGGTLLSVDSKEARGYLSKSTLRPLTQQVTLGVGRGFGHHLDLRVNFQHARRKGGEPYRRLAARGSLNLGSTRVYLEGLNLLDAEYPDVTGALAPGRALFLGMELGRPGR